MGLLITPAGGSITYTPVISGASAAGAGTYSTQQGWYSYNGNMIDYSFKLTISAHTGTGNYLLSLPVTAFSGTNYVNGMTIAYVDSLTSPITTYVTGLVMASGVNILLQSATVGGGAGSALAIDVAHSLYGNISYAYY